MYSDRLLPWKPLWTFAGHFHHLQTRTIKSIYDVRGPTVHFFLFSSSSCFAHLDWQGDWLTDGTMSQWAFGVTTAQRMGFVPKRWRWHIDVYPEWAHNYFWHQLYKNTDFEINATSRDSLFCLINKLVRKTNRQTGGLIYLSIFLPYF